MNDSVLVGCPTYSGLSDHLDTYLAAYSALKWPEKRLILVDNTRDGGAYSLSITPKVEAVGGMVRHIDPSDDFNDTFFQCWRLISSHAEANGYDWVLSLEQDVIVPPLTLDAMLNVAGYCVAPFVVHTVPYHFGKPGYYQGLGLTLMKSELLWGALNVAFKRVPFVEAAIYDVAKRGTHVSLHEMLDVKHLDGSQRHQQFPVGDQILDPGALVIEFPH